MESLLAELHTFLRQVEKPARYVGGEYGSVRKAPDKALFSVALSFPDLYEIGMSNLAIKYLYSYLNEDPDVRCERVFAPAPDMEQQLRQRKINLFTLENFEPVRSFDMLAFSIGYELQATNILTILQLSGIALNRLERNNDDPLVIAGGPAITNPAPFGQFLDAVYIGEAEEDFLNIIHALQAIKKSGGGRTDLLAALQDNRHFWTADKKSKAFRHIWHGFTQKKPLDRILVPSLQAVQDVGQVEIMRGCQNGCRFCHAGYFYRPFRERDLQAVYEEVKRQVSSGGYREITLSSLSTGDYSQIIPLVKQLNAIFKPYHVSFSLPSLKINTFSLSLLEELSEVRKSGITFAVETPGAEWQRGINKEVSREKIISILKHARENGWRVAKFYFMLGLPVSGEEDETAAIVEYLKDISEQTRIKLNINIGTFIPKAHTPFQRDGQLTEEKALEKIHYLKNNLKGSQFKIGYHSPFASFIEGVISRGDHRVGEIILQAFTSGARLDAWEEYLDWGIRRQAISDRDWDVEREICSPRPAGSALPWDSVSVAVSNSFFNTESVKSRRSEMTTPCEAECPHLCGSCDQDGAVSTVSAAEPFAQFSLYTLPVAEDSLRTVFTFSKTGIARYYSHRNMMSIVERMFQRAGIKLKFSSGFNPKPKMEFALSLAIGLESDCELLAVDMFHEESLIPDVIERLNKAAPAGLLFLKAFTIPYEGKKIPSLAGRLARAEYEIQLAEGKSIAEQSDSSIVIASDAGRYKVVLQGGKVQSSVLKTLTSLFTEITAEDIVYARRTGLTLREL